MQGNGEQKGSLKDRLKAWRLKKQKEKRQKELKKQDQKQKERQLKIKNSQVFSKQTVSRQTKHQTFFMICIGFFAALFEAPSKRREKKEIKKFEKSGEEAPTALITLKTDVQNYTDSLEKCLDLLGKEIDTVVEIKEFNDIQSKINDYDEGLEQVKEKYEMIKDRHHIHEEESMLGLTKSKEVIVEDSMSMEARQSILATTSFITARLEKIEEKLKQIKTELEVKEKEWNVESTLEKKEEEKQVVATIHAGNETIEITEKPFHKKASIARPQPAVDFLKSQNEMMEKYEERIEEIHRASFQETKIDVLEQYLKELNDMNKNLSKSLTDYKGNQEKYNIHSLIAFEDIRLFDRYRLTVSDVKIREILRHTTGEKENIESCMKEEKEKLQVNESKKEIVDKQINVKNEKKTEEKISTEKIDEAIEEIQKILVEQENTLHDFHNTLSKCSIRVRKENHFSRFKHFLSSFVSMSFGVVGVVTFQNPLMKVLTGGIAFNSTVKNLRRALRPEMTVEMMDVSKILKNIKTRQDCIEQTIDVYSSTLTEIEWLKEDFEKEFKAYESIHQIEYQKMMNQIEQLKELAEKELVVAENMKEKTKQDKQKVLKMSGK